MHRIIQLYLALPFLHLFLYGNGAQRGTFYPSTQVPPFHLVLSATLSGNAKLKMQLLVRAMRNRCIYHFILSLWTAATLYPVSSIKFSVRAHYFMCVLEQ
ncbi:hypothetical protein XENTR_v10002999 [Xenopus tropicalis]|nr:hypothetical protein XENTR_v10002999 [Xenopus tropicalis]